MCGNGPFVTQSNIGPRLADGSFFENPINNPAPGGSAGMSAVSSGERAAIRAANRAALGVGDSLSEGSGYAAQVNMQNMAVDSAFKAGFPKGQGAFVLEFPSPLQQQAATLRQLGLPTEMQLYEQSLNPPLYSYPRFENGNYFSDMDGFGQMYMLNNIHYFPIGPQLNLFH